MAKISRKEARDILFGLLFEVEFKQEENPTEIYNLSCSNREIPGNDYIKDVFFGVISRADVIDAVIGKYSKGWRSDRLSRVSRTVLRIAIYEILFVDDIHPNISISQAVELVVKYGEDKAKQFVNGVLSGVYRDWEKDGAEAIIAEAVNAKNPVVAEDAEPSDECDEQ